MTHMAYAIDPTVRIQLLEEAAKRLRGKASLGRALGYLDGAYVGQMIRGERPVTEKTLEAMAGIRELQDLFSQFRNPTTEGESAFGKLDAYTVPSHILWEELMQIKTDELPGAFRLAVPDDALAPKILRGTQLILETGRAAKPGQVVLVETAAGSRHLRRFSEGQDGVWQARAPNEDYATFNADRDGLKLLAVLKWIDGESY